MTDAAFLTTTGFEQAKVVGAVGHFTASIEAWGDVAGVRTLQKVDPSTLRFRVRDPEATEATLVYGEDADLLKTGTGSYAVDVDLDKAGAWTFRWEAAGDYVQAEEGQVVVRPTDFAALA